MRAFKRVNVYAAGAVSLALVNMYKECIFEVLRNSFHLPDLTDLISKMAE